VSLRLTKRPFGLILGRMSTISTKGIMSEFLARRGLLVGGVTLALAAAGARLAGAAAKPTITVHKSPT
jgi:hypothetical protein